MHISRYNAHGIKLHEGGLAWATLWSWSQAASWLVLLDDLYVEEPSCAYDTTLYAVHIMAKLAAQPRPACHHVYSTCRICANVQSVWSRMQSVAAPDAKRMVSYSWIHTPARRIATVWLISLAISLVGQTIKPWRARVDHICCIFYSYC